jgi:hypothetical protein
VRRLRHFDVVLQEEHFHRLVAAELDLYLCVVVLGQVQVVWDPVDSWRFCSKINEFDIMMIFFLACANQCKIKTDI